jgi:hypothetical protein
MAKILFRWLMFLSILLAAYGSSLVLVAAN